MRTVGAMKITLLGESFPEDIRRQIGSWCRSEGVKLLCLPNLLSLIEAVGVDDEATILFVDLNVIGPGQCPRDVIKFLISEKGRANLAVIPVASHLESDFILELFQTGVVDVISDATNFNSIYISMIRGLRHLTKFSGFDDSHVQVDESMQVRHGAWSSGHAPQIHEVFDFFKSEKSVQGVGRLEYVWPILLDLMQAVEPVPISNLAISSEAPLSTVTRIVKSLCLKKIVTVSRDAFDKRRTLVEISCEIKDEILDKFNNDVLNLNVMTNTGI